MDSSEEDLGVEVVNVDYYLSAPLPLGALAKLPSSPCYLQAAQVPVVRVFGATPAGQKTCVHIHGLFPYFYFRAEGDPAFDDPDKLCQLLPRIASELEKANELKQQQRDRGAGQSSDTIANGPLTATTSSVEAKKRRRRATTTKLVAKLLIVKGMPFYGYHHQPRLFVQIFLYNPRTTGSVVQLLESGCIADRVFQPYEAHIPFLLQVFADYSIEGMNLIHLSNVKFRAPLPHSQEHLAASTAGHEELRVLLRSTVPSAKVNGDANAVSQSVRGRSVRVPDFPSAWFDRQSTCSLEVDVAAECILNPQIARKVQEELAQSGESRNVPSLAALWEEERQRRRQNRERCTPDFSLSVERHADPSPKGSAAVAQSAASSLLSQSFFRQKMEDAASKIIEKLKQERTSRTGEDTQKCSGIDSISPLERVAADSSSLSAATSNAEIVDIQNNTIATDSAFSFSQAEHEIIPPGENDIRSDDEDRAIMDLLLSMRHADELQRQENMRSQIFHGSFHRESDERELHTSDSEDSDGDAADDGRLDEIGDILASQRAVDWTCDEKDGDWWKVVDGQVSAPSSSSVFELGSPRLQDLQGLKQTASSQAYSDGQSTTRVSLFSTSPTRNSDSRLINDIEDLAPPTTPTTSRPRKPAREIIEEEEDSVPFDLFALSPIPRPRHRRGPIRTSNCRIGKTDVDEGDQSIAFKAWVYEPPPPSLIHLIESSKSVGVGTIEHTPAFYGSKEDIPEKPLVFSGKRFDFAPTDLDHTPLFDTSGHLRLLRPEAKPDWSGMEFLLSETPHQPSQTRDLRVRIPVRSPPTTGEVSRWCSHADSSTRDTPLSQKRKKRSRINEPLTTSLDVKRLAPSSIISNLTTLSIEVHANSRGLLLPDPRHDRIEVICYAVEAQEGPTDEKTKARGVIMCNSEEFGGNDRLSFCIDSGELDITFAVDEKDAISKLEELVQHWDPDFLTGFEVQRESIGYVIDRAAQLNVNLIQTLSRLPTTAVDSRNHGAIQGPEDVEGDESDGVSIGTSWGVTKASGLWIHGRFILNLWRLARSEVKLSRYAREDIVRAVLKHEFPLYSSEKLTAWYNAGGSSRWRTVRYTLLKAKQNLRILSRLQLIARTSEMARLFGMDFYSVLSRGSQYRVESMMLRLTKRRNYLLVSPSRTQVARQAPMECIPLVMEPHSSFYSDPVVVLDFQSLYPSLVIGYNLCFSTIYGRLRDGLGADLERTLGVVDFTPSADGLIEDEAQFIMAPNGVLLSSKPHRLGVLPVMLDEILSTRIMVKNAMKKAKERKDDRLEKVLNARQLALKLLANVTYGYTAAGFSGRMPCAQLADSIVQSGRCTLEAAIRLVEGNPKWNAKVVYGDTDSLFVLLHGRSKSEAFVVGQEIADAVTAANPKPVTLKMEKVYMGCILVSKKRYVGMKYESRDQVQGIIEAKGVEIVRRDSCGVVQASMERCLELLFTTSNLSLVKQSLEGYWTRMLEDQIPLKEFIFAKEVRLGTYARGSAPPAALVSAKAMAKDPRAEPRYAERVPYVVVNGPPGARLMDLVVSPTEFVDRRRSASLIVNYQYYIHKQMIPSLERLFLLMGADVRQWFSQLPRIAGKARGLAPKKPLLTETRSIDSFYMSKHCRLCGAMGQNVLCLDCESHPQRSVFVQQILAAHRERSLEALRQVCTACGDRASMESCGNVSCAVWNRIRLEVSASEQDECGIA